jgi:phosphomannomutase/phosphoglucomutase
VVNKEADLGIAYDGDADRFAIVDERGRVVPADKVIALLARDQLRDGPETIVYDQKCSRIVEQAIHHAGGQPVMERSGHTFIKTTFLMEQAAYAGELSGHHFFRTLPQGDDGVLGSLFFARMLQRSGLSLSELVDSLPDYPITPDIRLPVAEGEAERILLNLQNELAGEATLRFLDGIRAEYPDGWGLARQSVTEPKITLRFEAETTEALRRIMARFTAAVPELAGRLPEVE